MASYLKHKSNKSCETHKNTINFVNLAQDEELSLKREEPLAQATSSRLGETANRGHVKASLKLAHLA